MLPFPIDYTKDFPACGTGGIACVNGYPSFCTSVATNITFSGSGGSGGVPTNGNIYCATGTIGSTNPQGTTVSASDPSTWDGSIRLSTTSTYTWDDTFVGGTINFSIGGNTTLSSCGYAVAGYTASNCSGGSSTVPPPVTTNYPVFYATSNSSTALTVSLSGGEVINGDMFAPNGTAALSLNGNKTLVTMIESFDVSADISGTFRGDGPAASTTTSSSSSSGTDALVQ